MVTHELPINARGEAVDLSVSPGIVIRDLTWIDVQTIQGSPRHQEPLAQVKMLLRSVEGTPWPPEGVKALDADLPLRNTAALVVDRFIAKLGELSPDEALAVAASRKETPDGCVITVRGKIIEVREPSPAEFARALKQGGQMNAGLMLLCEWCLKSIDGQPHNLTKTIHLDVATMFAVRDEIQRMSFPTEAEVNAAHTGVRSGDSA